MFVCAFLIPKPFQTVRKESRGERPTGHRRERKEPKKGILFYKLILYIFYIKFDSKAQTLPEIERLSVPV